MGFLDGQAQELMSQIAALMGPPLGDATHRSELGPVGLLGAPDTAMVPAPPWQADAASWSRKGAEEAAEVDAQLSRVRQTRGESDQVLVEAVRDARAAARDSRMRLRELLADIETGVRALQPSLDTPAGRQQLVDLLHRKAQEATGVIGQAQDASKQAAAMLASAQHGYVSITV